MGFNGKTLGHRLHMAMSQYLEDVGGDSTPAWTYLSSEARGAWETVAVQMMLDEIGDSPIFLKAVEKVLDD